MFNLKASKMLFLGLVLSSILISISWLFINQGLDQLKSALTYAALLNGETINVHDLNTVQQNIALFTSTKAPRKGKMLSHINKDFLERLQPSAVPDNAAFCRAKIAPFSNSERKNVLIVSQPRSGSSFLGQIFNQHRNVFYLFEPLRAVTMETNEDLYLNLPSENYNVLAEKLLSEILECRFRSSVYLEHFASFHRFSSKALSSYPLCHPKKAMKKFLAEGPCLPFILQTIENLCRLNYSFSVFKILTHRIPNQMITSLLSICTLSTSPKCKVIHLVRDPRALISSQMKLNFMRRSTLKTGKRRKRDISRHTRRICNRIHDNLKAIKHLPTEFLPNYKLVKFEDLFQDLENVTRNLYRFAGIPFKKEVLNWIEMNTQARNISDQEDPYSTLRNSSAVLNKWKQELSKDDLEVIERHCAPVIGLLGYDHTRVMR